jgi:hypothetical protein
MKTTLFFSCLFLSLLSSCGKNHYLEGDPYKLKSVSNTIDAGDLCLKNPTAAACDFNPAVKKIGVVTILLALGDMAQESVVINEESSRLIAQNAVKFATPVANPKILVVKDFNNRGESVGDTEFISEKLLVNYETQLKYETPAGLTADEVTGFDLIWFNNPGYPMGSLSSFEVLKNFEGGIILSGDDLTQGAGFKLESLVGLKYIDNGTRLVCENRSYNFNNNTGYRYRVTLEEQFMPGLDESVKNFEYGNDIDNSSLSDSTANYEVLAYANGAEGTCEVKRPVIVRYER